MGLVHKEETTAPTACAIVAAKPSLVPLFLLETKRFVWTAHVNSVAHPSMLVKQVLFAANVAVESAIRLLMESISLLMMVVACAVPAPMPTPLVTLLPTILLPLIKVPLEALVFLREELLQEAFLARDTSVANANSP